MNALVQINKYNSDKQKYEKRNWDVGQKVPEHSRLVSSTVFDLKIAGVENKIPGVGGKWQLLFFILKLDSFSVETRDSDKYLTTIEFNKFVSSVFDTKLKQMNSAINSGVNVFHNVIKNQSKIRKLQIFCWWWFSIKNLFHFIMSLCIIQNNLGAK